MFLYWHVGLLLKVSFYCLRLLCVCAKKTKTNWHLTVYRTNQTTSLFYRTNCQYKCLHGFLSQFLVHVSLSSLHSKYGNSCSRMAHCSSNKRLFNYTSYQTRFNKNKLISAVFATFLLVLPLIGHAWLIVTDKDAATLPDTDLKLAQRHRRLERSRFNQIIKTWYLEVKVDVSVLIQFVVNAHQVLQSYSFDLLRLLWPSVVTQP